MITLERTRHATLGTSRHVRPFQHVFRQYQGILGVELKAFWVLNHNLKCTVQELNENWRNLSFIAIVATGSIAFAYSLSVSTSRVKGMAKAHEILLHQSRKAFACAMVWIKKELSKNGDLTGTIPSMRTMQQVDERGFNTPLPTRLPKSVGYAKPLGIFHQLRPLHVCSRRIQAEGTNLLIGISNGMNVSNVAKLNGCTRVVRRVLIAIY